MTWNGGNGWLGQASFDSWDGDSALRYDPARTPGTAWFRDHRSFAPDGASAKTIAYDESGATKAWKEALSVCPSTPEPAGQLGQSELVWRPRYTTVRGWPVIRCAHDDTGNGGDGSGRSLVQTDTNVATTKKRGVVDAFLPAGSTKYSVMSVFAKPNTATMTADQVHGLIGTEASTWNIYMLWDSGTTLYIYILHQGATGGTKLKFINITGIGATNDVLVLRAWWDGTNVNHEVRAPNGTLTASGPTAVDGLGTAQTQSKLRVGGLTLGLSGFNSDLFAESVAVGDVWTNTGERAKADYLATLYAGTTADTFVEHAAPLAPTQIQPTHLRFWQGAYTQATGLVTSIANLGLAAVTFGAAGGARPTYVSWGIFDAFSLDGLAQYLTMDGGIESAILSGTEFTAIGLVSLLVTDEAPSSVQAGPAVLYGTTSGITFGNCYAGGDAKSRGPMPFLNGTLGPHGGEIFGTIVRAFGSVNTTYADRAVCYTQILDPTLSVDSSPALIRARAAGEMQSDYGDSSALALTGGVTVGRRGAATYMKASKCVVPAIWDVRLTRAEYQAVEAYMEIGVGLMAA